MDRHVWEYNPYALEVAPFATVSQNDFYTLSVRGMAHYVDGQNVDFTGTIQLLSTLPFMQRFPWWRWQESQAT